MFFPNALLVLYLPITVSISLAVSGCSPASGAVFNNASLSSVKSTCPLSSSSNAAKADMSSVGGDSDASSVAMLLRYVGRFIDCDDPGGKNGAISELPDGRPIVVVSVLRIMP